MELLDYEIDLDELVRTIQKKHMKRILLQLPEGLKSISQGLVDIITQRTAVQVLLIADPCYGACDLPCIDHIRLLGIDAIVHIGHTCIPSMNFSKEIPVMFLNACSRRPVIPVVHKALAYLTGEHIGILTTAQHLHTIPEVQSFLKSKGYDPIVGSGDARVSCPGQILGCNFSSAKSIISKVDSYLYIGSGTFHLLGLRLSTQKPVVAADPYSEIINTTQLDELKERILRQRYAAITLATKANNYGVLIGLKPGQQRNDVAINVLNIIQDHGKKAYLLTVDHIDPMILQSFPSIDCFVSTLCPRIAIDDYLLYKKPIITPMELFIALGKKSWDEYVFDEIV